MNACALMGTPGITPFVAGWATKGNSTTHHSRSNTYRRHVATGWAGSRSYLEVESCLAVGYRGRVEIGPSAEARGCR